MLKIREIDSDNSNLSQVISKNINETQKIIKVIIKNQNSFFTYLKSFYQV